MLSESFRLLLSVMDGSDRRQYLVVVPREDRPKGGGAGGGESSISYVLRGLSESEVDDWTKFCASVFSYKENAPAPEYFARHFWNDPDRDAAMIRVALFENAVVASCRVFQRRISLGNDCIVLAGGIGEVCTDERHRKRGLSRELLRDCIDIMKTKCFHVSLLHAAPTFVPFYQSFGYVCSTTSWCEIYVNTLAFEEPNSCEGTTRLANIPNDIDQLVPLHHEYSERRWAGCIIRSKEYWSRYVSQELHGSLWVYCKDDEIQGWASIRQRGSGFQLREFGCQSVDHVKSVFSILLDKCITEALGESKEMVSTTVTLQVPAVVMKEIGLNVPFTVNIISNEDTGWMYKALTDDPTLIQELCSSQLHLIWPTDSF
jgi:predicted GNAT family N-acyltransferase